MQIMKKKLEEETPKKKIKMKVDGETSPEEKRTKLDEDEETPKKKRIKLEEETPQKRTKKGTEKTNPKKKRRKRTDLKNKIIIPTEVTNPNMERKKAKKVTSKLETPLQLDPASHTSPGAAEKENLTPVDPLSEYPHGCPLCPQYFELIQDLYSHLKEHQDIDSARQQKSKPERHRCLSCSLDFFTRPTFISHLKTHDAVSNPFSCSHCPQSFPKQWYLKRHLLLHSKEKKFSCDLCSRNFSRKDHFQDHSRRCSVKRKRNKCRECPSKFATRRELFTHKIQVHGLKTDFYCFLCRLFFPNEPSLDRHLLTHKLMTFYCKKCDRHFNTDKELILHSRKIL